MVEAGLDLIGEWTREPRSESLLTAVSVYTYIRRGHARDTRDSGDGSAHR